MALAHRGGTEYPVELSRMVEPDEFWKALALHRQEGGLS